MAKREINDYTSEFLEETEIEIKYESLTDSDSHSARLQYDSLFLEEIDLTLIDLIDLISEFDWIVISNSKDSSIIVQVGSNLSDRRILEVRSRNFYTFLKGQKRFGKSFMQRRVRSLKRTNSIFNEIVEIEDLKLVKK